MAPAASPQVSIVLPTHNRADVLGLAIQSALAQTWQDFELLVVGDGCTDHTAEVVRGFDDERITWLDLPKAPGVGYANRNVALRQARGEWIAYLAHDDLWFPDHLERLAGLLAETGAEFAYSRQLDISTQGDITPRVFNLHDPLTWDLWRSKFVGYITIGNVVHRADCLKRYGYWNEHIARSGDWELWMRIIDGGRRQNFAYWPIPTGLHFVADWRRDSETRRQRLLRRMRAWARSTLPGLKINIPPGVAEQEVVWRAMRQSPADWVAGIRCAVQVDLDRRSNSMLTPAQLLEAAYLTYHIARTPSRVWSK